MLCLTACFVSGQLHAEETLIEEVVAAVDRTAITRSQVEQEARIILAEKGLPWSRTLSADLLESLVERLIAKELLYQEMERAGLTGDENDAKAGHELLAGFMARFSSPEEFRRFLGSLDVSEESFAALMARNAKIEAFMNRRLNLLARVGEEEIDQEIARRKAEGKLSRDVSPEETEAREFVRQELQKRKYDDALAKWLADLSKRSRVQRLVSFTKSMPGVRLKFLPNPREPKP